MNLTRAAYEAFIEHYRNGESGICCWCDERHGERACRNGWFSGRPLLMFTVDMEAVTFSFGGKSAALTLDQINELAMGFKGGIWSSDQKWELGISQFNGHKVAVRVAYQAHQAWGLHVIHAGLAPIA